MGEKPPPPDDDDDDRERDVSEDPYLSAVLGDLESVGRRNDYKLGLAIAVFPRRRFSMIARG
jgi:hypothetical protein